MPETVGILAYGSLIDDPGAEISAATIETKLSVRTPLKVEFARSSNTRRGAPTLVPVTEGGAQVNGAILLLNVSTEEAANQLWRRETGRVGSGRLYRPNAKPGPNDVMVRTIGQLEGLDSVLYTEIAPNITPLTPTKLAELAIASARTLSNGRDGINYLIAAKNNGIVTALSAEYEREILRLLDATDLTDALSKARN